jgi:hypothetical protein
VKTNQHEAFPDEVDHWTPYADAPVVGIGLSIATTFSIRYESNSMPSTVRSLVYDGETQCLEVRFKWKAVHQ